MSHLIFEARKNPCHPEVNKLKRWSIQQLFSWALFNCLLMPYKMSLGTQKVVSLQWVWLLKGPHLPYDQGLHLLPTCVHLSKFFDSAGSSLLHTTFSSWSRGFSLQWLLVPGLRGCSLWDLGTDSIVVVHGLVAQLPSSMWNLSKPGIGPMSPVLADRLSTSPPRKSPPFSIVKSLVSFTSRRSLCSHNIPREKGGH